MSRRREPPRRLRRHGDGSLYDLDEGRKVELTELADDLRAGRHFRATRERTEADCTYEVLAEVCGAGLPRGGPKLDGLGSVFSTLLGGLSSLRGGTDRYIDDRERRDPRPRRSRSSRDRADWWKGEPE